MRFTAVVRAETKRETTFSLLLHGHFKLFLTGSEKAFIGVNKCGDALNQISIQNSEIQKVKKS